MERQISKRSSILSNEVYLPTIEKLKGFFEASTGNIVKKVKRWYNQDAKSIIEYCPFVKKYTNLIFKLRKI